MILILRAITIILAIGFNINSIYAQDIPPRWIADQTTGCKIWNEAPKPGETVTWSGQCKNGFGEGAGTLQWFENGGSTQRNEVNLVAGRINNEILVSDPYTGCRVFIDRGERAGTYVIWKGACTADKYANGEGILYWVAGDSYDKVYYAAHFTKRGLVMQNGHIRKNIPEDVMTVEFNKNNKCRSVNAVVKGDVDLGYGVLDVLVNRVVSLYKDACPIEWQQPGSFDIKMTQEEIGGELSGYIDHRTGEGHYGSNSLNFRQERDRHAENSRLLLLKQNADQVAAQQHRQRAEQAQQQAQRALNQRVQAYADKYGAIGWAKWDILRANPFAHKNKVFLFNTSLSRMITPTSGIFEGDILVSDIPKNAFTNTNKVTLAGKVLGNTNVKNQMGGEASVPHIKYLNHIVCQSSDCNGFFSATLRGN